MWIEKKLKDILTVFAERWISKTKPDEELYKSLLHELALLRELEGRDIKEGLKFRKDS